MGGGGRIRCCLARIYGIYRRHSLPPSPRSALCALPSLLCRARTPRRSGYATHRLRACGRRLRSLIHEYGRHANAQTTRRAATLASAATQAASSLQPVRHPVGRKGGARVAVDGWHGLGTGLASFNPMARRARCARGARAQPQTPASPAFDAAAVLVVVAAVANSRLAARGATATSNSFPSLTAVAVQ